MPVLIFITMPLSDNEAIVIMKTVEACSKQKETPCLTSLTKTGNHAYGAVCGKKVKVE